MSLLWVDEGRRLPRIRTASESTAAPRSSASTRSCGGSDYPHTESTVPQSRKILERILDGVPDEERRKIVRDNAARLYGFEIG